MNLALFLSGFLYSMPFLVLLVVVLAAAVALAFVGAPAWAWALFTLGVLHGLAAPSWLLIAAAVPAAIGALPPLRTLFVSKPLLAWMRKAGLLPTISDTEREAIEAGTVWVDGELFSGKPDFQRLLSEPYPELTEREQAYLDDEVERVCEATDDWEVNQQRDLPPRIWQQLKDDGFFGLVIPEEYGGRGFSALAVSSVVAKLCSRSQAMGITVMVPNSLGPAELLLHYGTDDQKRHWLPRLASGQEVPCFALTEPNAGSDAGSISSSGEVFRGEDGELYVRLTWNKRYITLAAVASVLGLAFKLRDPDELMGRGKDLGITCGLIPTDTPGVVLGKRHDPLGVPFYNCPTTGKDVVVKLEDAVIGGADGCGRGWRMLMECLAAGRGIMLPASATAGARMSALMTGSYTSVRQQFGLSIGKFEGIHEPMARIGGTAYLLEAARRTTCGGLDSGNKPAVVTAIAKYNFTEALRRCINDAMDVVGGAGISRGPKNSLAHAYCAVPICITVEGANILTRTLMIFGQGAIRCHPYAYAEIGAVAAGDAKAFDRAFFGHIGHVFRNGARALLLTLTRGAIASSPVSGPAAPYYKKLAWSSASFAFLADVAMASLGGDLKRKEMLAGRFSDIFGWMYLANATLTRFEAEGRREADLPFFRWAMDHAFANMQEAFDGLYQNLPVPVVGPILRGPVALWSRLNRLAPQPSDRLSSQVARALQTPGGVRDWLADGLYLPKGEDPQASIGKAFELCVQADGVAAKIKAAVKAKTLPKARPAELVSAALEAGVITADEAELVQRAEEARREAVAVDSFTLDEYMRTAASEPRGGGPVAPQAADPAA